MLFLRSTRIGVFSKFVLLSVIVIFHAFMIGACSSEEELGTVVLSNYEERAIKNSIDTYVQKKYGWVIDEYHIERSTFAKNKLYVIHKEDGRALNPGGGKSFSIQMDMETYEVIREFQFQ